MTSKERRLTWLLRHGQICDSAGWVPLSTACLKTGLNKQDIILIVDLDLKDRFSMEGDYVRANMGHSTPVPDLYDPAIPCPPVVGHRTRNWLQIKQDGFLRPCTRDVIHLLPSHLFYDKQWTKRGDLLIISTVGLNIHQTPNGLYVSKEPIPITSVIEIRL